MRETSVAPLDVREFQYVVGMSKQRIDYATKKVLFLRILIINRETAYVHYTGNDLLVWYFMISELLCMT
jgi:hypothetical protein